jgi:serine/threonine protein kinase
MIPHGPKKETVRLTSISAMDIWSVGIMLILLMYEPCQWVNPDVPKLRNKNSLLREVVKSVGGETRIPIGDNVEMDLAEKTGFLRDNLLKKNFKMPLYDSEQDDMCDEKDTESYMVQYSAKNKELDDMHDFLKSMMKLSPANRPNATSLLGHPFMDF